MNVFIVYAHPEPKSFNRVMKELVGETLEVTGRQVVINGMLAIPKGWIDRFFARDLAQLLIHNGILRYSGLEALPSFVAYMLGRVAEDSRKAYLDARRKWLSELDTIPRVSSHPTEDYSPKERLNPGGFARSEGQHNV